MRLAYSLGGAAPPALTDEIVNLGQQVGRGLFIQVRKRVLSGRWRKRLVQHFAVEQVQDRDGYVWCVG